MYRIPTIDPNDALSLPFSPSLPPLEDHPSNTNLISINSAKNIKNRHHLSVLSLNIQSLNSNYDHLCTLLDSINYPEIAILSETWQPRLPNTIICNYHPLIHFTRQNRKGGSCGIFISQKLEINKQFIIQNLPNFTTFEFTYAQVNSKTKFKKYKYLIISVYRPPNTKVTEFLNEFDHFLSIINDTDAEIILAGDINIAINSRSTNSKKYSKLLYKHHLLQTVQSLTHYSKTTQTLIDHVLTNINCNSHVINCQIATGVGIHLPILTTITKSEKRNPKPHKFTHTELIERNTDNIIEALQLKDWHKWVTDTSDLNCNDTFNSFHDIISDTISAHTITTTIKKKLKLKPKSPWITEKTLLLKQTSNKLQKKYIRNKSLLTYNNLLDSIKEFKRNVKIDKESYYRQRLADAGSNSKQIWQVINELLKRKYKSSNNINQLNYKDKILTNPKEIADGFNQFYKNIAVDLAKKIPAPSHPPEYYLKSTPSPIRSFILQEISETDILREIRSFKSKSSSGFDNIPNKLIKTITPTILYPLVYTINKCFKELQFPERLKISKVTPLFKKGNPEDPNSFRPIHQVSGFSKLIEKLSMHQVKQFHQRQNVIPPNQFGFQPKTSTYHALLHTKNKIESELNQQNYCILVSLDLSKCFDTLDIEKILPLKLHHYYKDPNTIKYLLSFFKGRKQFVKLGSETSDLTDNYDISCVQGSSTGPIIYTLYSADSMSITKEFILCFADDTNLIIFGKDPTELQFAANQTLEIINDYMCSNKLTLNVKKTVAILFTPKSRKTFPLEIFIGNIKINQVKETKFLGVTLDQDLKFLTHFNHVVTKVKQGLSALIQTKKLLSYQAKLKIFHGLIQCHLGYCPIIWLYNQPSKNIKLLVTLQKKAVRLLFNAKPSSHTENMFTISNITKLSNLCMNDILKFMYEHNNNSLPVAITNIIKEAESQLRPPRSKSNKINVKTYANTGQIAFDMINAWNNFEDPIKYITYHNPLKSKKFRISTVKKRIKTYLHSISSFTCMKKECHACLRTPNIQQLSNYTSKT